MTGLQKNAYKCHLKLYYYQILDLIFLSTYHWLIIDIIDLSFIGLILSFWVNITKIIHKYGFFHSKTEVQELRSIRSMINQFQNITQNLC